MKPDFTDPLPQMRDAGHPSVLVAPIQFRADHLEILHDLDIDARERATEAGRWHGACVGRPERPDDASLQLRECGAARRL